VTSGANEGKLNVAHVYCYRSDLYIFDCGGYTGQYAVFTAFLEDAMKSSCLNHFSTNIFRL